MHAFFLTKNTFQIVKIWQKIWIQSFPQKNNFGPYAKKPLLMVLVQFWDYLIKYIFVKLLLKSGFRFPLGPLKMFFFKDILFMSSFPIVIPILNLIANLDHEGVELSLWNVLLLISAPKDTIKNINWHQPTSAAVARGPRGLVRCLLGGPSSRWKP